MLDESAQRGFFGFAELIAIVKKGDGDVFDGRWILGELKG